jgi:hypothetical protein
VHESYEVALMRRLLVTLGFLVAATSCGSSENSQGTGELPGVDGGATQPPSGNGDASATNAPDATSDAAPTGDGAAGPDGVAPGVAFSFVVVGCNRLEKADLQPNKNPSTANVEQLSRTFTEVAKLTPPPKFFFFAGDMVYGFTNETDLAVQLQAWLALYDASPLAAAGVELVPLPGNHESQAKSGTTKLAYPAAETTWVSVMGARIKGQNGPAAGGPDALQTDQSKLTYSFDYAGTHFVMLNTDPVGDDWHAPAKWVAADVAAARAAGARHLFAIGHKPAYPSPLSGEGGLSMFPASRDEVWSALEGAHAEAMLSAHNHLWYKTQPAKTWQVVAGNGGSLLESGVTGKDAFYGFTQVSVAADGRVTVTSYGRDVPAAGYNAPAPAATYPTTVRDTFDITWK